VNKLATLILDDAFIKLSKKKKDKKKKRRSAGSVADSIGLGTAGLSRNKDTADYRKSILDKGIWYQLTNAAAMPGMLRQAARAEDGGTYSAYNPMNYATIENAARAAMLTGAAGGTYLGGMDPRAAAIASAGALGGGMAGGYLGKGIGAAIDAYKGTDQTLDSLRADQILMSGFGAAGGLTGGLAAGKYLG